MTVSARRRAAFSAGVKSSRCGPVGEVGELVVGPAEVAGQNGVAGQAVGRLVYLAGADDDELFELGGDGAGIEDGGEMSLHGGEDFRPVGHDAEHVGHVAALGKSLVVEGGHFGGDFAAVDAGNAGHCASSWAAFHP